MSNRPRIASKMTRSRPRRPRAEEAFHPGAHRGLERRRLEVEVEVERAAGDPLDRVLRRPARGGVLVGGGRPEPGKGLAPAALAEDRGRSDLLVRLAELGRSLDRADREIAAVERGDRALV